MKIEKSGGIEVLIETLLEGKPISPEAAKYAFEWANRQKAWLQTLDDAKLNSDQKANKKELLRQAEEIIKKYGTP